MLQSEQLATGYNWFQDIDRLKELPHGPAFLQSNWGISVGRCQAGREYARAHDPNYKEGRPKKFHRDQINLALELLSQGKTYKQVESMTGISKSTIIRAKRRNTFDTD